MTAMTSKAVRKRHWLHVVLLPVLIAPMAALAVPTQLDFGNLQFTSSGQSMWGEGTAIQLNESFFLGETWNTTGSLGDISGGVLETTIPVPHPHLPSGWECHGFLCSSGHFHDPGGIHIHNVAGPDIDTRTGGVIEVQTAGRVGFNFGVQMDSGSVDTSVTMGALALVPEAGSFGLQEFVNLNPQSNLAGGQLSTNFPEISAQMQAVLGVQASAFGEVCFIGLGCDSGSTGNLGFADQTLDLVSFNAPDSPGEIKILGALDPAIFQFDSEISIPSPANPLGSIGGVTVHVPDINTVGGVVGDRLVSGGSDDLIKLTVDLDGLALAPLGLPGGGVSVNAGIFNISADLIDVDMGPILTVVQNFEFSPTLWVDLAFDVPVMVAGLLDPVMSLSAAWDSLPDFALLFPETFVTPTFSLRGIFSNDTLLGVDGIFELAVLQASLGLEAFGLSLDLGQLGPLFGLSERGNLFNTPPLFSNDFSLAGFNSVLGQSFLLSARQVPEPGMLALFGIGLLALGVIRRRQQISI